MATAAAVGSPSDTECSICHEFFTEPKLLPCAHLLCRNCLVTSMKSEKDALCPLCRAEIVDLKEKTGHKLEDIADSFPTDHSLVALVDATKLLSQPHVCKVCVDESASSLCLDCGDMLCCRCTVAHEKLSATSHHTVEDLLALTPERLTVKRPVTCVEHTNRPSELYCQGHDAYLCFFCAKKKYQDCENIQSVDDLKEEQRKMALTLMTTLSFEETRLTQAAHHLDQRLAKSQAFEEYAMSRIQAACERLMKDVEACYNRLERKVMDASREEMTIVTDGKNHILEECGKLVPCKERLQNVQESLSESSLTGMTLSLKAVKSDFERLAKFKMVDHNLTVKQSIWGEMSELEDLGKLVEAFAFNSLPTHAATSTGKSDADAPCFHTNHGINITLSSNNQTARRLCGDGGGIIFSSLPMVPNKLYEVHIDEVNQSYTSHAIYCGISMISPVHLSIPEWSGGLKTAIVISPNWVRLPDGEDIHRKRFSFALSGIGAGHRVGLALYDKTSGGKNLCVCLYVNGKCQGVAAQLPPYQVCYAMFDLIAYWKQVTILPLKDI